MMRSEAIAAIQRRLAYHTGLSTTIIDELKYAQTELEGLPELPFFLRTEVSEIDTTATEERVPVPTDFIRELEDEDCLYYFNAAAAEATDVWTPLAKEELRFLRAEYPGEGPPAAYYLGNEYFRIFPTPDAAYRLKMIYLAHDDVLDSDIENKWLKHRPSILIARAGLHIAQNSRDSAASAYFAGLYAEQLKDMTNEEIARQEAGRTRSMGLED